MICYSNDCVALSYDEKSGDIIFPVAENFDEPDLTYLFSIDDERYFLRIDEEFSEEGFSFLNMRDVRKLGIEDQSKVFAVFTAYHLAKWYDENSYCGRCGGVMTSASDERALECADCGHRIYPRINPAVIIGVQNGDSLLITRYRTGYKHNALVAGFTEFGETMEETVVREVMEETGLKVKNVRYYKSQPWGIAQDILMGFFCEVDGDDKITMDEGELKFAEWIRREDIELQPKDYSLTNEMMKVFKEGKI